jgi:polyphenol oxidase
MKPNNTITLIQPNWPAPDNIGSVISTRIGGVSDGVYSSANLGDHVGDDKTNLDNNRAILARQTGVTDWFWLQQTHGVDVAEIKSLHKPVNNFADASVTTQKNLACVILTADCLPILLCNKAGNRVAAAHAGWRGLAGGILENTLNVFDDAPENLLAYLGPAIGPKYFEVGEDVYTAFAKTFTQKNNDQNWRKCFVPIDHKANYYLADLYALARCILTERGIHQIYGGDYCTFADAQRFYSYRRDGVTGRMASAIWIK